MFNSETLPRVILGATLGILIGYAFTTATTSFQFLVTGLVTAIVIGVLWLYSEGRPSLFLAELASFGSVVFLFKMFAGM